MEQREKIENSSDFPQGVSPRFQEKAAPEIDKSRGLDKLFYFLGLITRKSLADKKSGIERSRQLRRTRAKLYKNFKKTSHEDLEGRRAIIDEAKLRDTLEIQFLNQGEVSVDLDALGSQSSRYAILELPEEQKPQEAKNLPPIVFIQGISNDLIYGISLVEELALGGRKVITVGYPESTMGKITPEFAKESSESDTYEPHVTFFKSAINKLLGANSQIELWGHSTGSAMIGQMLIDSEFSERVQNAVLLCPASSVDQTKKSLYIGIANDFLALKRDFGESAKFTFTPQGMEPLKKTIYLTMEDKVRTKFDYTKSHANQNGRIVVLSSSKDRIVKSADAEGNFRRNPQVTFIEMKGGYHATPMLKPKETMVLVSKALGRS